MLLGDYFNVPCSSILHMCIKKVHMFTMTTKWHPEDASYPFVKVMCFSVCLFLY